MILILLIIHVKRGSNQVALVIKYQKLKLKNKK